MLADGCALEDLVHVDGAPTVLEGKLLPHRLLSIMIDALLDVEVPKEEAIKGQECIDQSLGPRTVQISNDGEVGGVGGELECSRRMGDLGA